LFSGGKPGPDPAAPAREDGLEPGDPEPMPLTDVPAETYERLPTGLEPFDAVLGGGMVAGSVIVLGAEPGAGKSSLVLQACVTSRLRTLYATGEETVAAVAERARRLGVVSSRIEAIAEQRCEVVLRCAIAKRSDLLVIDSISKLVCNEAPGGPGSPGQIKACTDLIGKHARKTNVPVIMVSHVNREDAIAGPRTLEHDVDVVLLLEIGRGLINGKRGNERILRCAGVKNRGGSSNVVGRFEMTDRGLVPLPPAEPATDADVPEGELS
jgi:DNA repair protein RadA/Sms